MSEASPRLELPLLAPSQAQKHVTHNEALQRLDILVQLVVEAFDATDPPAAPQDGEIHALGAAPTGAWAEAAGQLAYRIQNGWVFLRPRDGWRAWGRGTRELRVHVGGAWVAAVAPAQTQDLGGLGIATTSDATNRLSVVSPAALFSHAGSDHRIAVNKAASGDTASLVFQTGFSGRAEMGLAGGDDWGIKVSPDGSAWTEALRFAAASGLASGAAVQSGQTDATDGRLMAVGAFGLGGIVPLIGNIGVTNASIPTGLYRYQGGSSSGGPAGVTGGHLLHTRRGSGGGEAQLMIVEAGSGAFAAGTLVSRSRISGAWSEWRRAYDTASVVGTVAQTGGVPTGALMEQASTANGWYRRTADGMQVCTHVLTSLTTADLTWSFPAAFAASTTPVVTVQPVNADARIGVLVAMTATTATVAARNLSNARVAGPCHLTAIGRWF